MSNLRMLRRFWMTNMLLFFWGVILPAAVSVDSIESKRVLIINSYGEQITWSKNVADSLQNRILKLHPDWMVYSSDLKTESAVYSTAATFTLRSIVWGYAERSNTSIDATSLKQFELFVQDDVPDAIVWIGEEGFMHYVSFVKQLGAWEKIPMVLCAVKDSVSAYGWKPEQSFRFDHKRSVRDLNFESKLNYSGNVAKLPIRQNLELIHRLLPHLKELIWVDADSYRSMETRLEVERELKKVMPKVQFKKMISNRLNTDSIYEVMLTPAPHRAFLTYSWNISGYHSKRSDKEIDSLFTHAATVPLFTLTQRNFNKDNYWVGGCFLNVLDMVDLSMNTLERALEGEDLLSIPFDTLLENSTLLNWEALERYGLTDTANQLEGATLVHRPLGFLRRHEGSILLGILLGVAMMCYALVSWRRNRYNQRIEADYSRYKRLYNKLQVIYENSSIDFALYDKEGKVQSRTIHGILNTSDDNHGVFAENIFEHPSLNDHLKKLLRLGRSVTCEVSLDKTGNAKSLNLSENEVYQLIVKPLPEVNQRNSSFVGIAVNLTSTVRERQEKKRFEELFHFASSSSQVGVVFYDVQTGIGMASESWCTNMNELFVSGIFPTYAQVMGKDRELLLNYQAAVRAGNSRNPLRKDIQVEGKDGEIHWIRQHMYFIKPVNRLIELSLSFDQQKQKEQKLEEAKRKAEAVNEDTRTFLNSISHEMRTPLNAIIGFSIILSALEQVEEKEEYAAIILRNVRLLDALINNLLELSALDGKKITFCYSYVNVANVFVEMETYIRTNLDNRSLLIVCELPAKKIDRFVYTDQEYLHILLCNLLSNAVKFTKEGSVTMGFRKAADHGYFYVTDTGCGVSLEEQESVFNRFVKLDEYTQGTGLGLALCKSIVKHLNGDIGVTSEKGKGSTFWFVLPLKS